MSAQPHIPAESWLVEWQDSWELQRCSQTFYKLARADEYVATLMIANRSRRVWLCGSMVCAGEGFD